MNKEQFDKMYVGKKIAVHCPTEELAKEFLKLAHEFGYRWNGGDKYINDSQWKRFLTNTCYNIKSGMYASIQHYMMGSYKIVEFKPTFTKSDLKSGDKVVYRNGDERWVLVETGTLHTINGDKMTYLKSFKIDLTYDNAINTSQMDIMQVYRNGVLIWQRNEETPEQKELKEIEARQREIAEEQKRLADRIRELSNK